MAKSLHIVIAPDTLFHIGPVPITNTLFTSFLISAIFLMFLAYARTRIKQTDKPTGLQSVLELIVGFLYDLTESVAGHHTKQFFPLVASFFIFIAINNLSALLPGFHSIKYNGQPGVTFAALPAVMSPQRVFASSEAPVADDYAKEAPSEKHEGVELFRSPNSDINMTLALGLLSVGATQYFGLSALGFGYLKKFFNFSNPINTFVGLLELLGDLSKILSFSFRLFGNIFAGGVLISVISFLIPAVVPVPFLGFEIFVGLLQAYVFAMLSVVFFTMATHEHH